MAKKVASKSSDETPQEETPDETIVEDSEVIECGLVMPISEIDGCPASHWETVKNIIVESLKCDYLNTSLVSDSDESGIIHNRIIQNLYTNPIVVCDVSGKNPNVMFELGMRLAFDMPTVVIKDDKTEYSFDTSPIEHVPYPRDLNYPGIVKFMKALRQKVDATLEKKNHDDNYSSFLGNYQIEKVAKIKTTEISSSEYFMEILSEMSAKLDQISRHDRINQRAHKLPSWAKDVIVKPNELQLTFIDFGLTYNVATETGKISKMSGGDLADLLARDKLEAFVDSGGVVHPKKIIPNFGKA